MKRSPPLAIFALLAASLACAVPPGMTPTAAAVTQVVVVPNEKEPDEVAPLPMPTSAATSTTVPTGTPAWTATNSPTPTLSGPSATFIKNANCRAGPGTSYDVVTAFPIGQTVVIAGRNPDFDNTWWYVEIPSGGKCWVSLSTAQATGPFEDIPIIP